MLSFNSLLIFSENPKKLSAFYEKVLESQPGMIEGDYTGFQVGSAYLMIGPHDKVHGKSTNPERLIFNFETPDVENEFERMKNIGATVIAEPYHPGEDTSMTLATLADIDGNYFQLATPMGK
ncbi:MAG TPA: VOC family protein [Candidatus Saccharimonadales bacterium]|nr:VOC family protein [Candidatus Saccharimonadales bacterium]